MQQADFAADILLLRGDNGPPPLVGSALSDWLITNRLYAGMPPQSPDDKSAHPLPGPVISLNQPQYQVEARKLLSYSAAYSVSRVPLSPTPGRSIASYSSRQPAVESAVAHVYRRDIADR